MIYQIEDVSFSYPAGREKILDHVSFSMEKGEILSILGPNGAGKTTLLNCMAGILKPHSGKIKICGIPIEELNVRSIAQKVGYVPQTHTPAFNYSVFEFVLMGRAPEIGIFSRPKKEDEALCSEALEEMGIYHLKDRSYMEISGGERQQAMIARAIVQEPEVILFDEPTAHLDYGNQQRVLKLVKTMAERGFAVAITTHNPDHALLLDGKAAVVDKSGKMICGRSREIITEERLRQVYRTDLRLLEIKDLNRIACLPPKL